MGILGSLGSACAAVATLPLAVAADVVTLGGVVNDRGSTYTGDKVEGILEDLEDAAGN